jgi:glycosyltransferase involved in cell wall biosynthesis
MRVMLLCPEFATGGAERHWDGLAPALQATGHEVRVVTFIGRGPFYESLERRGVACTDLSVAGPLWLPLVLAEARWRPDVVVTRAHNAHVAGSIMAALARGRHVLNWHRQPGKPMSPRQARIMRLCASRGDLVIAVSGSQLEELHGFGFADDQLVVIPNGVPPAVASTNRPTLRNRRGVAEEQLLAVAVGRLAPEKRLDLFVEAIAEARRRGVDASGWILGDGELHDELAAQIARLGVPVRLLGQRADVADHLLAADAICVTSDFEALPMVILEALAAGLPVIATRVGGIHEAVRDGTEGILVPPGDAAVVADALERMADSARRAAFAQAARARHVKTYDLATMTARYGSALMEARRDSGRRSRSSDTIGTR